MSGKRFFDTNILIYTVAAGDSRADKARAFLAEGGIVSAQVLNEFAVVARRKYQMPWPDILEGLAAFRVLCPGPVPVTLQTHERALQIA
jgi:predicted nucleic acid-binding protein